jgi:hypothetical protein
LRRRRTPTASPTASAAHAELCKPTWRFKALSM